MFGLSGFLLAQCSSGLPIALSRDNRSRFQESFSGTVCIV